jgi:hypothetical protein
MPRDRLIPNTPRTYSDQTAPILPDQPPEMHLLAIVISLLGAGATLSAAYSHGDIPSNFAVRSNEYAYGHHRRETADRTRGVVDFFHDSDRLTFEAA